MEKFLKVDLKRKFDVTLFGRVTVDLNPTDINRTLDKSFNFNKYLGGSTGNIAVGLARHGLKVSLVSSLSQDQFGTFIKNYLKNSKVDLSCMQKADISKKTGLTFTEMKSETESSILMYREKVADLSLLPSEDHEELIKNSKILFVSGSALSKSPSREAVLQAIMLAKKHKTWIVFDIDYRPYNWSSNLETQIYYGLVADQANFLIGSKEEFGFTQKIALKAKISDLEIANYYFSQKSNLVIIKHGSEGSFAYLKNGKVFKIDIFPIRFLKGFGGGDAYISSFISGILKGKDLITSLTWSTAAAAFSVSQHSCSDSLMVTKELEDFIEKNKEVLPVVHES